MFTFRKLLFRGTVIISSMFSYQAISTTTNNNSPCKYLEQDLEKSSLQGIKFIKPSDIEFKGNSGRNRKLSFLSTHEEDLKAKHLGSFTLFSGAQEQGVVVEVKPGHVSDRYIINIYFKNKSQKKDRLAISNEYTVKETNTAMKTPNKLHDVDIHFKK